VIFTYKVILHGRIVAADGRFTRMCLPIMAQWRHVANTIELVLLRPIRIHIPTGKSIGSAVLAQLTNPYSITQTSSHSVQPFLADHGRVSLYFTTVRPFLTSVTLWTRMGRRKHKFHRIHEVAPMCPYERAHCRHVANTTEPSVCGGDHAALCQISLTTCY